MASASYLNIIEPRLMKHLLMLANVSNQCESWVISFHAPISFALIAHVGIAKTLVLAASGDVHRRLANIPSFSENMSNDLFVLLCS